MAISVRTILTAPGRVRAIISSFADSRCTGLGAVRVRHVRHTRVANNYFRLCYFECELALALSVCAMLVAPARVRASISSFTDSSVSWPWRSPCAPCSSHLRACEQLFPASLLRAKADLGAFRVRHARNTCVSYYFQPRYFGRNWPWRSPCSPHLRVCEQQFPASLLRARSGWPWRSACAPRSPHLGVCEQQFPASLIRDAMALAISVYAMLATPACVGATTSSFVTSSVSWPRRSPCAPST